MTTDLRIPQLPGIDPRDYAIDFTGDDDSSDALEDLLRDLVQYTVAGAAVGQSTKFPTGLIATTRPILVPFTQTDVGGDSNTRLLSAYGCRIVPDFAYGDVIKFYIPQTLVGDQTGQSGASGANIGSGQTAIKVTTSSDFSGLSTPFSIRVGEDSSNGEEMTVTNVAGTTWTVTRATGSSAPWNVAATHTRWKPIALKITSGWMTVNGLAVACADAPAAVATTTLNTAVSSAVATSIIVDATAGGAFPIDSPFTIFVSDGTHEEPMLVTAGVTNSGTQTWTVTRNYGGAGSAQSTINSGATITMQSAVVRLHGSASPTGGTWLHKFTFRDLNFQDHGGHGLVQEGNTFENAVVTPHAQAASDNTLGANLLLQNIGSAGVSSIDIYGGTLTGGRRGLHNQAAPDVKVFGGTYLTAYKEGIAATSSQNMAIYGAHVERNYQSGIPLSGGVWDAASTNQAGIYLAGGGLVSGVLATNLTTQRYAVRVFATRPVVIEGGYALSNTDYFARIEGSSAGRVTIMGVKGGSGTGSPAGGGTSDSSGVWHDGTSGTVPITAIQNTGLDGISIDGALVINTASRLNDLGAATGSYSMGNNTLLNLAAAANQKDAVRYDQLLDPLPAALTLKNWNIPMFAAGTGTAFVSGTIYALAVWLPPGLTITGAAVYVTTGAAGNKPTGFFVGLASDNGGTRTMRAQSGDVSGNSGSPFTATGINKVAFSATYLTNVTDSPTGLHYVVILQDGTWASTNPLFNRGIGTSSANVLTHATGGASQSALPANSSTITLASTSSPLPWYVGVY